jgi:DNA-binding MarR family transcriptional regulator
MTVCQHVRVGDDKLTGAGEAMTRLVLTVFRASGTLNAAGDELVADQDLTSARWQVLGAIQMADRPLTVAQIARRMGLTRQSVHASVQRLRESGLLVLMPNEAHRRSPLVGLTEAGLTAHALALRKQVGWVNWLSGGVPAADIETAERVIDALCRRLTEAGTPDEGC